MSYFFLVLLWITYCVSNCDIHNNGRAGGKVSSSKPIPSFNKSDVSTVETQKQKPKTVKKVTLVKKTRKASPLTSPPNKKSSKNGGDIALKVAKGFYDVSKKTMKSGFDIFSNKHVTLREIVGKWKFSQEVLVKRGVLYSCPATIQFLKNGTVISIHDGQVFRTSYEFTENKWPRFCKITFNAYAFQGPYETEPVNMFYKGYFKKSFFNKKTVLMRGKIYRLSGKLWKKKQKCGTFKATLRA